MSLNRLIDETVLEMSNVRNEPVQHRSATRISALLDAAAEVVDEVGVERLTTAMVAERAGASIGTVYRYFPDRIAVLAALSVRALDRFLRRAREDIIAAKPKDWIDIVLVSFDSAVDMHRTEPGYTSVRLGELVSYPEIEEEKIRSRRIAEAFAAIAEADFGVESSPELVLRLEVAVGMADAMITRAFLVNRDGDPRFLDETRQLVRAYLEGSMVPA